MGLAALPVKGVKKGVKNPDTGAETMIVPEKITIPDNQLTVLYFELACSSARKQIDRICCKKTKDERAAVACNVMDQAEKKVGEITYTMDATNKRS